MARKIQEFATTQNFTVACGASDASNVTAGTCPSPKAQLLQASFTQNTAGTGTGTFSVEVKSGSTSLSTVTANTFIDADAVAGTIHGIVAGTKGVTLNEGDLISIATVKNGTVSGNATLAVCLTWRL